MINFVSIVLIFAGIATAGHFTEAANKNASGEAEKFFAGFLWVMVFILLAMTIDLWNVGR